MDLGGETLNIRSLCLAILSMGDASGYEINKLFQGPFSHIYEASFGSIYPALGKLTEDGLVTCTAMAQEKKPDKKVYRLTQTGRAALLDELAIMPGADRVRSDFLIVMMFAHLLPAGHVSAAVDKRLEIYCELQGHLAKGELEGQEIPESNPACTEFVRGYGVAMIKASIDYIEENRHLVESASLLAETRAAE